MPIDLTRLSPDEAERLAYTEGFPMAAQLFARIADATEVAHLQEILDAITVAAEDLLDVLDDPEQPSWQEQDALRSALDRVPL